MRLSKIKLAGFKSFVDSTIISFPSNLVGVVGPNGCGKSNVIDAVRWVMGESSAKHLRGAAMLDVIFNGSGSRRPAESASIELIFEHVNLPQYPPDSEIAIKRQLTRDGQSHYFMNGVRCRRKDITDLFLGTGLGPRSYAIIEQGMISRLIEAKPDDLRVFLEEAAGISKYKERRKETTQRMKQTLENLEKLDSVRLELNKQVEKLKKQAKQAETYQELKKSEYLLNAQLQGLQWYGLDTAIQTQQQQIDDQAKILETDLLALHNLENTHQDQRQVRTDAQKALEDAQQSFYQVESEITRLTQTITHIQERHEQTQWDLQQLEETHQETQAQLQIDQQQAVELAEEIQTSEITFETLAEVEGQAEQDLQTAETQLQDWQATWEAFNQRAAEPAQRAQVERANLQNLEQRLQQSQQKLQRQQEEGSKLDVGMLEKELDVLELDLSEAKADLETAQTTYDEYQDSVVQLREEIQPMASRLQMQQTQVHQLSGRLASLEALQENALGKSNIDLNAWLQVNTLNDAPRLAEFLTVETGWEKSLEVVLNHALQALCIDDLANLETALAQPPQGHVVMLEKQAKRPTQTLTNQQLTPLLSKVSSPFPVDSLLAGIYTVDTLANAYKVREQLLSHESVITPEGVWLGNHWLRSQQGLVDEESGIIAREQEIKALAEKLAELEQSTKTLTQNLEQKRLRLHDQELSRDQAHQQLSQLQQAHSELQSQHGGKQARLEHIKTQIQRIAEEKAELTQSIEEDSQSIEETRHSLHATLEHIEILSEERDNLSQQRGVHQEKVEKARYAWQEARHNFHQIEISLQSLKTDATRLQQGITRLQTRVEQLAEQRHDLQVVLDEHIEPLETAQTELEEHTSRKTQTEETLLQSKQTVEHLESSLTSYEEERRGLEEKASSLRGELEKLKMAAQTDKVRRQTIEEQLEKIDLSPVALLAELPDYADEESWVAQIEAVARKLEKLGAVNLAALSEYEEQAERKKYFDEQAEDLNKALKTLENAIKTIDRETKVRFQETLDSVNGSLVAMFPRLFGGGQAHLELVGDDLLKSGVAIIARPPGKRNSTIHLLSGGEKALTAIALVFAIFELNPAPFCMLDEVDAPLDDTNVGRFSALVKSMSGNVQFIFISHNKITMEIAEQLVGVTMQEAGVSRPVAVDLDKAVGMLN